MTHPSPGKTAAVAAAILDWCRAHAGQVPYSETNYSTRLKATTQADLVTPTDCSGLTAKLFKLFAGLGVGTFTGDECFYGQLVTTDKAAAAAGEGMLPCDVILFNWPSGRSTWDHIAIYAGNGRIWNHGGPGAGPLDWSLASNVDAAVNVMVRRFLTWDTDPTKETGDMDEAATEEMIQSALLAYSTGDDVGVWTNKKYPHLILGHGKGVFDRFRFAHDNIQRLLKKVFGQ